jgi:hypothetical protein
MPDADLSSLVRRSEQTTTEIAMLRDAISALTGMVLRVDGSVTAVLQESATRNQIARINNVISDMIERLQALEVNSERSKSLWNALIKCCRTYWNYLAVIMLPVHHAGAEWSRILAPLTGEAVG